MKSLSLLCLTVLLACASALLLAAPAHYWKWRSKLDGKTACSQTQLGQGWEKFDGPFYDAQCHQVIRTR